ncbi:hypothetical protein STEG23_018773, partial [Scotinomys teguina]
MSKTYLPTYGYYKEPVEQFRWRSDQKKKEYTLINNSDDKCWRECRNTGRLIHC